MTPQEFLAAVLPPLGLGYYCAVAIVGEREDAQITHKWPLDAKDIAPLAADWAYHRKNAYFAPAVFEGKRRLAKNATHIRCIALDMDGYATKREAGEQLGEFLARTGLEALGLPIIVSSGGGLHCYWPFTKTLSIEEWKPVAEAFKALCVQEELRIDMTVTADAARILRVPETLNFKDKYDKPRAVKVLSEGKKWPFDFGAFTEIVQGRLKEPVALPTKTDEIKLEGERPKAAENATATKLMETSTILFKDIVALTSAGKGCAQLAHYVENASQEGMEPLWRALLSQTKYCADGDKAGVWLSKLHPYDDARRVHKLSEIKGPYPCTKFASENPGVCSSCPHFGKITNPLALGRKIVTDTEEKVIEISQATEEDPTAPALTVLRPKPPRGYAYGAEGGVFVEKEIEEADGVKRKKQVMLLPYTLFVADLLNKDGEYTIHLVADRPGKAIDVLIPQRSVVSKDDLMKSLAQQNIIAAFGSGNDKNLFDYVRACVEEASTSKTPIKVPAQYGWQEDDSFVYSGRVYYKDGTSRSVPMPDLVNLTRVTRSKGTIEEWRKFPQLLMKRGLYEHLSIACIAFGSPLMRFTQFSALTIHGGSTDSGTGKSLALSCLSSVWGHPLRYRTGKSTSPVTMQQRMGNLNSLPFTSDEITHKSRHDMEWFPGMVFDASEGQGKEKSEVYHNRERVNNVSWSLLAFFTSNTHMHDYMSGVRSHTSQGELLRMLEWSPTTRLEWAPKEEASLRVLNDNYGVAGQRFVSWLVRNQETAERITLESIAHIKQEWGMSGDERFWAAGCGAIIAGAILASSKYADVINLPIDQIINFYHSLVLKARKVVKSGARTAEDVLNSYTRDNYGGFVVLKYNEQARALEAMLGNGAAIDHSITRSRVLGRVEHNVNKVGYVEYFIEESLMKAHCVAMSFGFEAFKDQISRQPGYVVQFLRKDMMAKTKGPQMRIRAISISRPTTYDEELERKDAQGVSVARG